MSHSIDALQRSLSPILTPFSWAYGAGMRMRAGLYGRGLLPSWEPGALTVSVGNIGWGGTGKTPVAGWLLGWAESRGLEALLLTRGYKARPVTYPYLVKPGALAEEAGDEPLMLATMHPKARVVVDPVRTRAGRWAMQQFHPGLVVLDDGFQHLAVKRHLDLVLLRPDDLAGQWNRVIPAGSWREPVSALKRADAFMIKIGPENFARLTPFIKERLERFRKPVFSFQIRPTGVRHVLHGNAEAGFGGGAYLLVTGVGDPEQVRRTAARFFGYPPARHLVFRDHHAFTKADVLAMQAAASRLGCEAILCTPKDAVKLGPMCSEEFWQFDLRLDFGPSILGSGKPFNVWWSRRFDAFNLRRTDSLEDMEPMQADQSDTQSEEQTHGKE
ncbi:MAG: tetraacyldisaccharide 4'-kinase [Pseudodesulfovibrio sp.]|uniref:Tetraacyldisaccharide 4'-kinase n=1 Tax=Pseudodesulfovibrio aespoeensis (strain ATCC 700646 / DSM 10631 / Aspo-2) TaxID=643562 RepID=E6VWW1_PSEA9|nr:MULTISPECIES: tetraacyldisaccharide 4'-kinase [Pseudodesulfovibrio]MBU4191187.1 tetraacyldisaccharide 4'-kinase [Pseudomonadota bacterium]ADU63723.1 tetraacyldisaccharide 4'-kinase [Pseudodesulfovibrio aespoeensis Aspo-2]MBU4243514.1 tetraacyldisaccharide 4'-kinase [Pseudomonadota bacterium]MBU4377587.1 tetraacyldisaccharide 4'-kinase [Pseudomonadota bacterium]MBU4476811.1 tetraacyldisaccharide 4'-kinase [Pseudomonadota bacterium]